MPERKRNKNEKVKKRQNFDRANNRAKKLFGKKVKELCNSLNHAILHEDIKQN